MSSHLIAEDTFVVTARGPVLADELAPDTDKMVIVRGGNLTLAAVQEATLDSEPHRAWRLLTPVGDILLAEGSFVMTRDGPLGGDDIELRVASGRPVRVEVVGPADLPETDAPKRTPREIYEGCLLSIPGGIIQVPRNDGVDELAEDQIERYLREAKVEFHRFQDERWLAYRFDAPTRAEVNGGIGPCLGEHADALLSLTAWKRDGDRMVSRVRFDDSSLRRRLFASLAGGRRGFEVKWLPAYRPIECRIYQRDAGAMKPFVPVQAALPEPARVLRLSIAEPGHLLVGLAVVAARPA